MSGEKPRATDNRVRKKEKDLLEITQNRSGMRPLSPTPLYHVSFPELAREPKLYPVL